MNYSELYSKAQKDLESVRVQKAQIKASISELARSLDLDESDNLKEQVEQLKGDLEVKQSEYASELDRLAKELSELDKEE